MITSKPNRKASVDWFNTNIRDEILDEYLFKTISQSQETADAYLSEYNEFRSHDFLCDMTSMGKPPPRTNGLRSKIFR